MTNVHEEEVCTGYSPVTKCGKFIPASVLLILFLCNSLFSQETVFPGAGETTPSRSEYFSWINNTNEGATEVIFYLVVDSVTDNPGTFTLQWGGNLVSVATESMGSLRRRFR